MTTHGDQILLGTSPKPLAVDPHTKKYLKKLSNVRKSPQETELTMTQKEYYSEVHRLREATSSQPSDTTPAMVNTEALGTQLTYIGRLCFNCLWCKVTPPKRYWQILDVLIRKDVYEN